MADGVKVKEKINLQEISEEYFRVLVRQVLEANNGQKYIDGELVTLAQLQQVAQTRGFDLSSEIGQQTTNPENLAEMVRQAEEAKIEAAQQQERLAKIKEESQRRIARAVARGLKGKIAEEKILEEIVTAEKISSDFSTRAVDEQIETVLERVAMDEKTAVDDRQKILQEKLEIIERIQEELKKEPVVEISETQQEVKPQEAEESTKVSGAPEGVVQQSSRSVRQMPVSSPESTDKKTVMTKKETFVYRAGEGLKRGKWRSAQANRNLEAEQKIFERQRKSGTAFKLTFNPKTWVEWVKNGFWGTGEISYPEPSGAPERYQPSHVSGGGGGGLLSSIKSQIGGFLGGKAKAKLAGQGLEKAASPIVEKALLAAGPVGVVAAAYLRLRQLPIIGSILKKLEGPIKKVLKYLAIAGASIQALLSAAIPLLLGFVAYKLGAVLSSLFTSLGPVTFSFGLFGGTVGGAVGWIFGGPLGALVGSGIGAGIGGMIGSWLSAAGGLGGLASAATGFFATGVFNLVAVLPTLAIPVIGTTLVAVTAFTIINTQIRNSAMVDFRDTSAYLGDDFTPSDLEVNKTVNKTQFENSAVGVESIVYNVSFIKNSNVANIGAVTDKIKIIKEAGSSSERVVYSGNGGNSASYSVPITSDMSDSLVVNTVSVVWTDKDGKTKTSTATIPVKVGKAPLIAFSCPVVGGGSKISCRWKDSKLSASCYHCRPGFYPNMAACDYKGNAYALDIDASYDMPVFLPSFNGRSVDWRYVRQGQDIDRHGANKSQKYYQAYRVFEADVNGVKYELQLHHMQVTKGIGEVQTMFKSGDVAGYTDKFMSREGNEHSHIQLKVGGSWVPAEDHLCN